MSDQVTPEHKGDDGSASRVNEFNQASASDATLQPLPTLSVLQVALSTDSAAVGLNAQAASAAPNAQELQVTSTSHSSQAIPNAPSAITPSTTQLAATGVSTPAQSTSAPHSSVQPGAATAPVALSHPPGFHSVRNASPNSEPTGSTLGSTNGSQDLVDHRAITAQIQQILQGSGLNVTLTSGSSGSESASSGTSASSSHGHRSGTPIQLSSGLSAALPQMILHPPTATSVIRSNAAPSALSQRLANQPPGRIVDGILHARPPTPYAPLTIAGSHRAPSPSKAHAMQVSLQLAEHASQSRAATTVQGLDRAINHPLLPPRADQVQFGSCSLRPRAPSQGGTVPNLLANQVTVPDGLI